ncbi:MAG: glutamine amidotransferase [Proteobacteria bacterium]|nr:glutamine amidotransferase [Pseudomonadota bacterium]
MPPKSAIAIRHVAFEDLDSFEGLLTRAGFAVGYREAAVDEIAGLDPDLLIVLGGPISVNDEADHPFLIDELRLIERRLAAGRATLGICLGAQAMAKALGARVYPAPAKELGWAPVALTAAGRTHATRHLAAEGGAVLHWHGETFDLPAGATLLASTPPCPHQAFALGRNALALQFHVEVTAPGLERWFIGHALEIATTPGVGVAALRAESRRFGPGLLPRATRFLASWLAAAGL